MGTDIHVLVQRSDRGTPWQVIASGQTIDILERRNFDVRMFLAEEANQGLPSDLGLARCDCGEGWLVPREYVPRPFGMRECTRDYARGCYWLGDHGRCWIGVFRVLMREPATPEVAQVAATLAGLRHRYPMGSLRLIMGFDS